MIAGVCITPLRQIEDERGKVMHMLRADSPVFKAFGEIYFSCIKPGAVKAWKLHQEMILNLAVPHGEVKLVLYDAREESETHGLVQEIVLNQDDYCLVTIPPKIWTGFACIGRETAFLANCASLPHAADECIRCDI